MARWVAALVCILGCGLDEAGTSLVQDAGVDVSPLKDVNGPDVVEEDTSVPDVSSPPDVVDAPGTTNWALQFSGGAYVDMGALPIPTDFTLEAWIHPTSANGETYVVAEDERNQSQGEFRLGLANGGKLFFTMSDSGGSSHGLYNSGYQLQSANAITTGVWTHVAVIKSGPAFGLTVNSAVAASFTASALFSHGGPPVNFRVGARVDTNGTAPNGVFDGIIDEVRLWNTPRQASEITQTMSMTVPPSSTNLFAYWRFDEGTGLAAGDQETAYPGTLVGNPMWVVSTAF